MNEEIRNKVHAKKESVISKAKEKGTAFINWCIDHPAQATVVFLIGGRIWKAAMREHRINSDRRYRSMREYDPSLGLYYDLRRPLTNREKVELSKRHNSGEAIGDILESFNVL